MTNKTLNTGNMDRFVAYVLSEVAETAPDVVNLDDWPNAGLGYGTAIYIGNRALHTEAWWNSVEDRLRELNPNYSLAYWWMDDGIYLIHKLADTYDDLTDDQRADYVEL